VVCPPGPAARRRLPSKAWDLGRIPGARALFDPATAQKAGDKRRSPAPRLLPALLAALLCAGAAAQVRFEDILKSPGENWLTYAGSYNGCGTGRGVRFTPQNAGSLVPKWVYHVPDAHALQTTPIVYAG